MESATSSFGLIDRIKQGDGEAFSFLFEKYRRRLAVLIHYRLSPQLRRLVDVDDILQEALLKAFNQFDQFTYQGPGSLLRWLSCIADHVIADLARYQGRQKRHAFEVLPFRSESNPAGPEPIDWETPSRLFAQQENVRALLKTLDSLPEDYRQAILLAKVEGMSTQEMAERLGKSREATALLLHRALKRFRDFHQLRETE